MEKGKNVRGPLKKQAVMEMKKWRADTHTKLRIKSPLILKEISNRIDLLQKCWTTWISSSIIWLDPIFVPLSNFSILTDPISLSLEVISMLS